MTESKRRLNIRNGKGKELMDMLRKELGLPEGVRWFEVRFAMDEPVSVKCDYLPTDDLRS